MGGLILSAIGTGLLLLLLLPVLGWRWEAGLFVLAGLNAIINRPRTRPGGRPRRKEDQAVDS